MLAVAPRRHLKVGGHHAAHALQFLLAPVPTQKSLPKGWAHTVRDDYFGTPTNRAPVSLPSALMRGA
jgi:hypothetical protein